MKDIMTVNMRVAVLFTVCLLFISGCTSLVAKYNEHAYERATALKVESLVLLDKAVEPYSQHQQEAEQLQMELKKAYEYVKGLDLNENSTKQWAILINPDKHLIGGALKRWKKDKTLRPGFINYAKEQVGKGFDEIIKFEGLKLKQPHLQ